MRLAPLALLLAAALASAAPQGFYRQPAVAGDTLVFVSQGDLWKASSRGGAAQRLTAHGGQEAWPVLLPDGKTLAFVAQIDGAGDVYTMPLAGGAPQRRSWIASAAVRLWGADAQGRLLLTAPALDGRPQTQPFRLDGKQLEALPVADASDAAIDGSRLYFTRQGLRGDHAKNYRGGAMAQLWVMDLAGNAEARPLLQGPKANDRQPMPYQDAEGKARVAFLSDRDGFVNLWSVAADGSDLRQHSAWKDFDLRHASLSGRTVVASRGADLVRIALDQANPAPQALPISLTGDHSAVATRWIKRPQDFLTHVAVAPNGERVALEVRGRLATQGTLLLRRAQLQQSHEVEGRASRCREPAFASDSKSVFAFCDFSGEMEVWQLDALGNAAPRRITNDGQMRRLQLAVSPDGRHLAHTDLGGRLYITDLKAEGGARTRVIGQAARRGGYGDLVWHPDGQALAYTAAADQPAFRSQLWLYSVADDKSLPLASERYHSASPAFSPDGQWLYFASRRHFQLQAGSSVWADRNMGPSFEPGVKLYALALQPGLRLPTAAKDEMPPPARPDAKGDAKPDEKGNKGAKPEDKKLPRIQLAGLAERLHELPVPAGQVRDLHTDGKRLWWLDGSGAAGTLRTLALEHGANPETHSERVRDFALSGNGKTLLIRRDGAAGAPPELLLVDAGAKLPADVGKFTVRWSDWQIPVQPREEWRQMFVDAWRMQRDHFYDAGLHGIDWKASLDRHLPLLERVGDRVELAELMGQMVSDLSLLHSQVGAGDLPPLAEAPPVVAGLGAQLEPHAKGARIARLYRVDAELVSERGPLQQPGMEVAEGDVITAINGRALHWPQGSTLLQGEAGKQLRLSLLKPDGRTQELIVTPHDASREAQLRYQDWRTRRAEAVAKASNGRIGYLHLRAMGPADIADFAREFYAQLDKEALILDVRFNNGGNIDSWILERLLRRAWAWWQPRHPAGSPGYPNMQHAFSGPLAMLINEQSYSDGETIAEGFKRLKLGTLIGKTTSGAGVWLSDTNRLIDNGIMRAAEIGQVGVEGDWLVEGRGVTPDIEVDNPPRATARGEDAQLQAAVAHLLQRLPAQAAGQSNPRTQPYPRPR